MRYSAKWLTGLACRQRGQSWQVRLKADLVGSNDASFNTGNGFNDAIILNRHMSTTAVQVGNIDFSTWPAFMAYPSASQSLTGGGADVLLACDTKVYDNYNNYNATTYTFTAPVAGVYDFFLQALGNNGTSSRLIPKIYVNSTVYNGTQMTDTYSSGTILLQIKLNANDTVKPYVGANPSNIGTSSGVANTRFSGKRSA